MLHHVLAGGRRLVLRGPRDAACLPPRRGEPPGEGRLPFWARVWPGGVALADVILRRLAPALRGRSVIELGAGLGTAGIAAGLAGAAVTLTDASQQALAFATSNARANGVAGARALTLDWRRASTLGAGGSHEVAVAAEVLYDPSRFEPLAAALAAVLAPGGVAWIADPERVDRTPFDDAARAAGLDVTDVETLPHPPDVAPVDGGEPRPIRLFRLVRRSGAGRPTAIARPP